MGIHTDEEIEKNKGPVVMHLDERVIAVQACKWCTTTIPGAPYVTDPEVMDSNGCRYVVHGDDITTDADGNDCYQTMKDLGRFIVVKRTPNISTTDLVGRMLSLNTGHHLPKLTPANKASHLLYSDESLDRFRAYATCRNARDPGSAVYTYTIGGEPSPHVELVVAPSEEVGERIKKSTFYVDGGFDLFFTGHIEFLRLVRERADAVGAAVVVGMHDDFTVHQAKGQNYPIMNQFERALCVLQCKYVDGVILGAPFVPNKEFLDAIEPNINVTAVLHGPTAVITDQGTRQTDPYTYAREKGLYQEIGDHKYMKVSTTTLVDRVLQNRLAYEERQRKKGWKAEHERKLEQEESAR